MQQQTHVSESVAVYDDYRDAQAAVDHLSDNGFPVETTEIVWRGLSHVEDVTGRRDTWSAALTGLAAGAWFGLVIGLIAGWVSVLDDGRTLWEAVLAWTIAGAAAGAIWGAVGHAARAGRRDFATRSRLVADHYDVRTAPELVERARRLLGLA